MVMMARKVLLAMICTAVANANLMNFISVDLENKNNDVSHFAKDLVDLFGDKILPKFHRPSSQERKYFVFH